MGQIGPAKANGHGARTLASSALTTVGQQDCEKLIHLVEHYTTLKDFIFLMLERE
jgi:hypothetical protein